VHNDHKSPELVELISNYRDYQSKPVDAASFTSLWGEELATHMAATSFVPLAKGVQLQTGRFTVLAILSSGGSSAVYLAQTVDGTMVILKESVIPQHVDDAIKNKAHELFQREATLLTKLNHPQIAKVLDHFRECSRDYLVLEYLPGKNLRQIVKQSGAQTETIVLAWAAQIVDILHYLHELEPPLVHRDLTPDNILLKNDGKIAVIDFGAANEYLGTATGTLIGKQSYISPEQFKGKATPKSDIYALGSTLFFLLTGDDPEALSVSHPKEQRADLSQDIDALVAWCTELEETDRATLKQLIERIEFLRTDRGSSEHLAPL
jgi:serine/threonine protein kinase